jgi:glycerophosphoryl diester phosphodiesterase
MEVSAMLPILVPPHFRIIAHRGASAYAPENTHAAFALAQRMGVTEVELDTQLTVDGEIALCHDSTLARYGYGPQVVEQMTWGELAALDMGSFFSPFLFAGAKMITLGNLFATYRDSFTYHVEIKGKAAGLPAAVQAAIEHHKLRDKCIVTSFSYDALASMRGIDATMRLGWLIEEIDANALAKAKAIGLYQLCPRAKGVKAEDVVKAREVVQEVRAWGLHPGGSDHSETTLIALIERVVESGCDGMTINWPDWVRHREE